MKQDNINNCKHKSMILGFIAMSFAFSVSGGNTLAAVEQSADVKERQVPETEAIMDGVEAKVCLDSAFDLMNTAAADGWVSLCDATGKGFGCPWIALSLDKDISIWGEEGAEVYVGTQGILRFRLADTENGDEISAFTLLSSGYEDETIDYTLYAEHYDWSGVLVDKKSLGNITEKSVDAYYQVFGSVIDSEINAIGASAYGDSQRLTVQNENADAVIYGNNGRKWLRYPGMDASEMHAALSNDGKILVVTMLSPKYRTEIFTVGSLSEKASDSDGETGDVYTDSNTIKMVQDALNQAGYECGTADGISGSRTIQAINNYRSDHGLEQNGMIDNELLQSFGLESHN